MTAKQLTDSILQLAIQGKLVPQDSNDEPASILLERIREEKRKLVEEKVLKKKDLDETPVDEEEEPFRIPERWEWCRLGYVSYMYTGNSISETEKSAKYTNVVGMNYIGTKDVGFDHSINYNNGIRIPLKYQDKFKKAPSGSVIMCIEGGSAGRKIGILNEEVCFGNKLCCFNPICVNNKFIYYYLQSPTLREIFKSNMNGIIGGVSISKLSPLIIPIPPLAEQHRIVERIEEILPFVKEYGEAYEEASKMDAELPDKLKKSILQEAIMGKLGTQNSDDEPASVLMEQIREEKKKLVKEGVLKKKDLEETPVDEEEEPFRIPDSWEWCKLGWLVDFSKSSSTSSDSIDEESWLLDLEDIEKDSGRLLIKKRMKDVRSLSDKRKFYKGNVLYSKLRPYLNKVIVADEDGYCTTEILAFDFGLVYNKYAHYYLMSPFFVNYAMLGSFGTKMPRLGSKHGNEAPFPLPPLAEQHRIVQRIEELYAEIDNMTINKNNNETDIEETEE